MYIYIYIYIYVYIYIYIYKRVSFGLRNTKKCSMTYRQSETYNRAKYLKTYYYSLFHRSHYRSMYR